MKLEMYFVLEKIFQLILKIYFNLREFDDDVNLQIEKFVIEDILLGYILE